MAWGGKLNHSPAAKLNCCIYQVIFFCGETLRDPNVWLIIVYMYNCFKQLHVAMKWQSHTFRVGVRYVLCLHYSQYCTYVLLCSDVLVILLCRRTVTVPKCIFCQCTWSQSSTMAVPTTARICSPGCPQMSPSTSYPSWTQVRNELDKKLKVSSITIPHVPGLWRLHLLYSMKDTYIMLI